MIFYGEHRENTEIGWYAGKKADEYKRQSLHAVTYSHTQAHNMRKLDWAKKGTYSTTKTPMSINTVMSRNNGF